MFRLSLFGRFSLTDASGADMPVTSKKGKALLAYLAQTAGKPRSREEILALLWSDRAEAQGRASLRQVLTGLRKMVGGDLLRVDRDSLALNSALVDIAPANGDEFLSGFHLNDPAFEEWLRDERQRFGNVDLGNEHKKPNILGITRDKPTIAVLPFHNLSGDAEQRYFSDGLTEDIITELGRFSLINVLARQSAFVLRDSEADIEELLHDFGADYLLQGSIRRAGDRIRLTAQLVDSSSRRQVWADRYDRELTDVFAIQDELVHAVVTAAAGRVSKEDIKRSLRQPPGSLAAYDNYLQALHHERHYTAESISAGRRALERALEIDPGFARAYGQLASMLMFEGWFRGTTEPASDSILALAKKGVEIDPGDADCVAKLAIVHLDRSEHEQARLAIETALAMNPHDPVFWGHYAWYLVTVGRPEEALAHLDQVDAVEPHSRNWVWDIRAEALYGLERYQEAAEVLELKARRYHYNYGQLAACYGQLSRKKEAARVWAKVLEVTPDTPLSMIGETLGYQNQEDADRWLEGLRKAGLTD